MVHPLIGYIQENCLHLHQEDNMNWQISKQIADHYEVINTHLPILESKIGRVDLRTITLDQADKIFSLGTRYLKKKPKKKVNAE